jgi:predicted nuclease with TOPRIM domain
MALSKDEIREKLTAVQTKLTSLEREKVQLEVKRDDFNKKVTELEPQIKELFGTLDAEKLSTKREELLAQLESLNLEL